MERPAGKALRASFGAGEPGLPAQSTPLGQGPQGDVVGEVFSGFLPGPSIHCAMIMALGRGAAASRRLSHPSPTRCSSQQPHQLGRECHTGAGMGKEVQLSLLFGPGVNRWDIDVPLPSQIKRTFIG